MGGEERCELGFEIDSGAVAVSRLVAGSTVLTAAESSARPDVTDG